MRPERFTLRDAVNNIARGNLNNVMRSETRVPVVTDDGSGPRVLAGAQFDSRPLPEARSRGAQFRLLSFPQKRRRSCRVFCRLWGLGVESGVPR